MFSRNTLYKNLLWPNIFSGSNFIDPSHLIKRLWFLFCSINGYFLCWYSYLSEFIQLEIYFLTNICIEICSYLEYLTFIPEAQLNLPQTDKNNIFQNKIQLVTRHSLQFC